MARQAAECGARPLSLVFRLRHSFPGIDMDMAFEVPSGGVTMLFGPSGCGKSTIINAAAGLFRPDECQVSIDGRVLADTQSGVWLPPERRRVGLVFQDAKLFPHMSIETNLRFGMRRTAPGPIRFDEVVDLLGVRSLLARRPGTLSGGERQRVAIGRALLAQPHLLLMDEPLASLDAPRKAEILPFLTRLKTVLKLPIIYVTHALEELVQLGDSVVLLEQGRVLAAGSLADIAGRADLPLGQRDDAGGVLVCRVAEHDGDTALTRLKGGGIDLWVPHVEADLGIECRVRIPAKEVILATRAPEAISLHNIVPGTVRGLTDGPARRSVLVEIAVANGVLLSRVTPDAVRRLGLEPGRPVLGLIKSTSIEVLGA